MVCLHHSPGCPMFQHRIENRQQFPHTCGKCYLLGFPCSLQALIEDTDHRIEPGGHDRAHIKHGADLCAPAPDRPSPSECAAVTVEWCHADKSCDLLVGQGAKFRETGQ